MFRLLVTHNIGTVITPGEEGVDGHPDHTAVHQAAVFAGGLLRVLGKEVSVWGLSQDYQGDVSLPVDTPLKLLAASQHASQRLVGAELSAYENLLNQETYRRHEYHPDMRPARHLFFTPQRDLALIGSELY